MKKKLILLPITLIALTPMVSMAACNKPVDPEDPVDPEVEPTEIYVDCSEIHFFIAHAIHPYTLYAWVGPEGASQEVVWTSSKPEIAKVENGVVTPVAPGEATITVQPKGYNDITATCKAIVYNL